MFSRHRLIGSIALSIALSGGAYAAPTSAFGATEPGVRALTKAHPFGFQIYPAAGADFGQPLVRHAASFGSDPSSIVVYSLDDANSAGPSTSDACTALTGFVSPGSIVLVDRGTCNFTVKVKNAQDAGASAVIVVNNFPGPPNGMTGTDPTIVIPSVMVSQELGAELGALPCCALAGLALWDITAPGVFDTTAPVMPSSPVIVNATGPSGAEVSVSATDNVDPAPLLECTPSLPTVFPIGSSFSNCQAIDANFNFMSGESLEVHVKGASEQVTELSGAVAALGLSNGTAKKLNAKLADADAAIAAGNTRSTCLALQDFISEVQKAGKKIAAADATRLEADAVRIGAVLGC